MKLSVCYYYKYRKYARCCNHVRFANRPMAALDSSYFRRNDLVMNYMIIITNDMLNKMMLKSQKS